jgi:hypothetical protein
MIIVEQGTKVTTLQYSAILRMQGLDAEVYDKLKLSLSFLLASTFYAACKWPK